METFQSSNKGYRAELNVVTYCRNRTAIDDKSKFRILLVSPVTIVLLIASHGRQIEFHFCLRILVYKHSKRFIVFDMYCLIL